MKAARVCFPFVGDTVGGSHLSALTLIDGLGAGSDFEPVVLVHEEGPLSDLLEARGTGYTAVPLPAYVGRESRPAGQATALAKTLWPLRSWLRRQRISIVHTNDARMHQTWTVPARLAGASHLWHQRTAFSPSRLGARLVRSASQVVCVSRYVAEGMPTGLRDRLQVIHNPVQAPQGSGDAHLARVQIEHVAECGHDGLVLGSFGNLRAVKQPLVFMQAALEVQRQTERDVVAAVFGDDRERYRQQMESLNARAARPVKLAFMGFRDPIDPWIAACDVVIAASDNDAFGRTLVEGMLSGVPVVAADAGGHREVMSDEHGFLVEPNDPAAFARAAVSTIGRPRPVERMLERARRYALSRYEPATYVERIEDLYRALMGRTK